MFAVLKLKEMETGFRAWLREKMYPSEVTCDTVKADCGLPFFVITAPVKRGKIPWDEIVYASGKCARRMLLPDGIEPPKNSIAQRYKPEGLLKYHILFNTVCDILKRAQVDNKKLNVCIIDRNAVLTEKICNILPFAGEVRIVTAMEEKYNHKAKELMEEYGISLLICNEIPDSDISDIVILGDEEIMQKNKMIFSVSDRENYITAPKITLPDEYNDIKQENIDDELLANALYELCKVRTLGDLKYECLTINGEKKTIYKLAQELKRAEDR